MNTQQILNAISQGRTDLILDILKIPDWKNILTEGRIKPLQWLVYYDDLTGLKAVLENGGNLESLNLNQELGNAAFFGHWKICEFLIQHGAHVNYQQPDTFETPLHNSLCKAGRPYFYYTVRVLLEYGANPNLHAADRAETGAFMRDAYTNGETPLHRAAAYADSRTIQLLIDYHAEIEAQDASGDTPLAWASKHLRPNHILQLPTYGDHYMGPTHLEADHRHHIEDWGSGMDWNLFGEYLPDKNLDRLKD